MPVRYYLIPYTHQDFHGRVNGSRQIFTDAQRDTLATENAKYPHREVLGDHAIVAVNARNAVLNQIDALPGVFQLPTRALDTTLADLTAPQKQALRDKAQALGYDVQEIQDRFGAQERRDLLASLVSWDEPSRAAEIIAVKWDAKFSQDE
jgi:hypothetical protein